MLKEARIIAQLEHPGIVPVHDVARLPDGRIYYVMKLVRGKRLDQQLDDTTLAERLRLFERICEPVAFAHAHGVIHRDLKPANIMVGPFGEVLVMDWGVAKLVSEPVGVRTERPTPASPRPSARRDPDETLTRHTAHGTVIGTPAYMAPEQARGEVESVDSRSDVYALGAILYFLITRRHPPTADTRDAEPLSPRPVEPETSRALDAVCRKATAGDPDERYRNVEELRGEVSNLLSGGAVRAYRESALEKIGRVAYRYRTPILLVAAYLLMRVLLIVFS